MVRHPANLDGLHLVLPGNAAEERPESFAQFWPDERPAIELVKVFEGGLEIPNEAGTDKTVIAQAAAIVRLDL